MYTRGAACYAFERLAPGGVCVPREGTVCVPGRPGCADRLPGRRFPWPSPPSSDRLIASMTTALTAIAQTRRGIFAALRSRAGVLLGVGTAVVVFNLLAPVALLSVLRRPADFFTFNPWLRRLPDYLGSSESLSRKLAFLSHLTIAWVSAEGSEGIDWGFIVDVPTVLRIVCTALIFGAYFALWSYGRRKPRPTQPGLSAAARPAGVLGVMTGAFGLTV